jgi:hypothetical protein
MKQDRFFHILRFLHFSDSKDEHDKTDDNFDRLWKMRTIFHKLNDSNAKYYGQTERLANDEIMLYKCQVVFKQYNPKTHRWFGIKTYKLCDSKGYAYDMRVYLGRDNTNATGTVIATRASVAGLMRRIQNIGCKLYMDICSFSLPVQ